MKVKVRTPLRPTEDPEKVKEAIKTIFPDAKVEIFKGEVKAEGRSLDKVKELLERQRIRDSAREILKRGVNGDHILFRLNKQVATTGRVNFSISEGPLGDLEVDVELEGESPEKVIDFVAPSTLPPGVKPKDVTRDEDQYL